jgi:AcrR family transcriptional regulator
MGTQAAKSRMPGAKRRELIVEAALEEFAELGYEAASVGRIAAAAGVSRTVLYDHFASKHELFGQLLRSQYAALLAFLSEPIASDAPVRERMQATYDAFFRFVEERPAGWRLLFPSRPPLDPEVDAEYRRIRHESNTVLGALLAPDARRAGVDPDSEVGRIIFTITLDALHGVARWWNSHPEVPRSELVRGTTAALWTGMGAADRGEPWVE